MNFLQKIKEVFRKMFRITDIVQQVSENGGCAITGDMLEKIEQWMNAYIGNASWLSDYVKSMRLEQGIVREFANVSLTEMTASVDDEQMNEVLQNVYAALCEDMQAGLATGSFIIKPLGDDDFEIVTANNFIPLEFGANKKLRNVAFVSSKQMGESEWYHKLEYHTLTVDGLQIRNVAYRSNSMREIGKPCPLTDVAEWAGLAESALIPGVDRMDFGYFRVPLFNTVDGTPVGISIFEPAMDIIQEADITFGQLKWEMESGERAVFIDGATMNPAPTKTNRNPIFPKLNKRLFKGLNLTAGNGKDLLQEYTPAFRESNIINAKNAFLRRVEFAVGLAYGDLSDVSTVEKTAEECRVAKQRKYNMVNAIQRNLKKCLEDFLYGVALYNGKTLSGYEVSITFADSILTDEIKERENDRADVSMGSMSLVEYRKKWYNESEEDARKAIAEIQQPDYIFDKTGEEVE